MTNTEELAKLLRERSEHDRLPPGPVLHERIARRRRLRAAGTAAVVVALAVAVAAPFSLLRGGGDRQSVADPPPTIDASERMPAAFTGGYRLADSKESVLPAGNEFTYTFTPETYDFKLMLWCDSQLGSRLRAFIGGKQVETDYCEPAGKRGEIFPSTHSYPVADKQRLWQEQFGVQVGTPVTVTVKVHTGQDENPDPLPPSAPGLARLLLYVAVPFDEYPFPDPPRTIPRITEDSTSPDQTVINYVDAFKLASRKNPINGYYAFSVLRQPGRDINVMLHARGPGILRVVVNQQVEVEKMEYWDWDGLGWGILIDQALLPAGQWVAIGIYAEHFSAPVWRVTATDSPEQPKGG